MKWSAIWRSGRNGSDPAATGARADVPPPGDPTTGDPTGGDPAGGNPKDGGPTGGDPAGGNPKDGDPTAGDPTGGDGMTGRRADSGPVSTPRHLALPADSSEATSRVSPGVRLGADLVPPDLLPPELLPPELAPPPTGIGGGPGDPSAVGATPGPHVTAPHAPAPNANEPELVDLRTVAPRRRLGRRADPADPDVALDDSFDHGLDDSFDHGLDGADPDPSLRLLAVCDPRIPAELRDLRRRMPGIAGALVATIDGVVLAHDPPGGDVHAAGRVALGLLTQGRQATVTLGRGRFRNSVIWGTDGYLAVYTVGSEALLLVQASEEARVGRLHVEARSSSATIAALLAPG